MSYLGAAPAPPRLWSLWSAIQARLDSARMQTILGGAGRIKLETDDLSPLGAETTAWGRVVIAPVRRIFGEPTEQPGRGRVVPYLVRSEVHSPGGSYNPAIALEAAQTEAFTRLHGWIPGVLSGVRIEIAMWRETPPQALPLWDEGSGLWFLSTEYRAVVAPE